MIKRALDAAGINDPRLRTCYEECGRLLAKHDTTHYLAGLALALWKRPYSHALYGFARHVDQMVDTGAISNDEKMRNFEQWNERLDEDIKSGYSDDSIVQAMLHTISTWEISTDLVRDFVCAMRSDLHVKSYSTYADLEKYMYGAASTLALQAIPILQPTTPEIEGPARSAGIAFQLTNIIRDVAEDLDYGRVYLPAEDMDRFGISADDLRAGRVTDNIRALIVFEIERARRLYEHAMTGTQMLHPSSRACWESGLGLYSKILDIVEDNDYQVLAQRVRVGNLQRLQIGIPAYLRATTAQRRYPTQPITPARAPSSR